MRAAVLFMPAFTDDTPVLDNDSTYHWIRARMPHSPDCQFQSAGHVLSIFINTQKIHLPFVPGRWIPKNLIHSSFIRTIPSALDSHQILPSEIGSWAVTTGGDFHPALKRLIYSYLL